MTDAHPAKMPPCTICGNTTYSPGPNGRMAAKGTLPPRCDGCGALERHRIVRRVYDAIPQDRLTGARALQFSPDPGVPTERLGDVELSVYGTETSLDMARIDRSDGIYDWVIANHVLEHIKDDKAAMREMLRVVSATGVIQLTIPAPSAVFETWELPEPEPDPGGWGHWRGYGSDFPIYMGVVLKGAFGVQVVSDDPVTGRWDVVYLFTKSRDTMLALGDALIAARLPTLRAV
ncbi:MAG: methyltransferase domain-containing protein [Pseudomonadota bacterium]